MMIASLLLMVLQQVSAGEAVVPSQWHGREQRGRSQSLRVAHDHHVTQTGLARVPQLLSPGQRARQKSVRH